MTRYSYITRSHLDRTGSCRIFVTERKKESSVLGIVIVPWGSSRAETDDRLLRLVRQTYPSAKIVDDNVVIDALEILITDDDVTRTLKESLKARRTQ